MPCGDTVTLVLMRGWSAAPELSGSGAHWARPGHALPELNMWEQGVRVLCVAYRLRCVATGHAPSHTCQQGFTVANELPVDGSKCNPSTTHQAKQVHK